MNEPVLGELITQESERDAVHIAIAPVIADMRLSPGEHVGFTNKADNKVGSVAENLIGIVDPLLKRKVMPGQKFWMWLYPNTVTSLRHHWIHPSFTEQKVNFNLDKVAFSKQWLTEFAERLNITYDRLIDGINQNNICLGFDIPDFVYEQNDEMWRHYEIIINNKIPDNDKYIPFRCAC